MFSSVASEQYLKKAKLGSAVTLYCDGNANSQDEFEIMWKTPYQLVAKLNVTKDSQYFKKHFNSGPGFENRVRFENTESKGGFSLHINPTVFSDTDVYSCFSGADLIKTWSLQVIGKFIGGGFMNCHNSINNESINKYSTLFQAIFFAITQYFTVFFLSSTH